MVEQVVDRLAEPGQPRDDEGAGEEQGDQQRSQGEGLDDGAVSRRAPSRMAPAEPQRAGEDGTRRPYGGQGERRGVEERVGRNGSAGPTAARPLRRPG